MNVASAAGATLIAVPRISMVAASGSVEPAMLFGIVPTIPPFAGLRLRIAGGVRSIVNWNDRVVR